MSNIESRIYPTKIPGISIEREGLASAAHRAEARKTKKESAQCAFNTARAVSASSNPTSIDVSLRFFSRASEVLSKAEYEDDRRIGLKRSLIVFGAHVPLPILPEVRRLNTQLNNTIPDFPDLANAPESK